MRVIASNFHTRSMNSGKGKFVPLHFFQTEISCVEWQYLMESFQGEVQTHKRLKTALFISGPVWPSGKALVRLVSGRTSVRNRFGSLFSSKRLWFVDTVL